MVVRALVTLHRMARPSRVSCKICACATIQPHSVMCMLPCRLGVLVEVNCETDFVARGDQFKELVNDIAMQIAASPTVDIVSIDEAPQEELERERALEMQKEDIQSKPENIRCCVIPALLTHTWHHEAQLVMCCPRLGLLAAMPA